MKNQAAVTLGSIRSDRKARAARENGKRGGRPKGRHPWRMLPAPPVGFAAHPQWKVLAANSAGDIMRVDLRITTPYWRLCPQSRHSGGYMQVNLPRCGGIALCHRIVYECCHGKTYNWSTDSGDGLTIDHINGNKADNRLVNLQVLTNYQNMIKHNGKHGLPRYIHKTGSRYNIQLHIRRPTRTSFTSKTFSTIPEALEYRDVFLAQHGVKMGEPPVIGPIEILDV